MKVKTKLFSVLCLFLLFGAVNKIYAQTTATLSSNSPLCEGQTGVVSFTIVGHAGQSYTLSGPNSYSQTGTLISDGVQDFSLTSISSGAAGQYDLTLDDDGLGGGPLSFQTSVVVNLNPTALIASDDVKCHGGTTGSATVTASGGSGTYPNYVWIGSASTNSVASGLIGGVFVSCIVTDDNGCSSASAGTTITEPSSPLSIVLSSTTNVSCFGGSNGSASVTASGGTGSYSYAWAPNGGLSNLATGLTAISRTVTVTDVNLCTTTLAVNITQPAALLATITKTDVSCFGSNNGSASVSASGGNSGYTYTWTSSTGSTASAATSTTGLTSGNYTLAVKDASACVTQTIINIGQPGAAVTISSITGTNITCYNLGNGSASVSASGGSGAYSYTWSQGSSATKSTSAVSNLTVAVGSTSAVVTVSVADSNAPTCKITQTIGITQPTSITATATRTNVTCNGLSNGSASIVSVSGGAGAPYTYTWSQGSSATNSTSAVSGLNVPSGTSVVVTATVSDVNGCKAVPTVTITQPAALLATVNQTNVACFGNATGAASVNVTGGNGSNTYTWTSSTGSIASAATTTTGLVLGTYTVAVKDASACVTQTIFNIIQPTTSLTASTSQTNVLCNGGNSGSAIVIPNGGNTASYTYTWTSSTGSTASAATTTTGLTAGNYTVAVKDASACVTQTVFNISQPTTTPVLTATVIAGYVACFGSSTSATVVAGGGTGSYNYSWSGGGASSTASTVPTLTAGATVYSVTITDANTACSRTQTLQIGSSSAIVITTAQTNVSCFGGNDAVASISVTGGAPFYAYTWASSSTTLTSTTGVPPTSSTKTGLVAGNYTVTVKDANQCQNTQIFTITQPAAALAAAVSTQNIFCNGNSTGSATITANGGTPNYTYSWTPNVSTGSILTNAAANNYTVKVTDNKNCTVTTTLSINQPTTPVLTAALTSSNALCNGANGSATVIATGGTGSYNYSWTGGAGTSSVAAALAAGASYTVTISDVSTACTITRVVSITQPAVFAVNIVTINVSCFGGNNGSALANASGGTSPYTYSWSVANGTSSGTSSLTAGNYTVVVNDANSCGPITHSLTITQPSTLIASSTTQSVLCNGDATGSATVTPSGGNGSYTYSWTPSSISTSTAAGLLAGNYTVVVTDNKFCSTTVTLNISQPTTPVLTAVVTATNVTCNGGTNGAAGVTAGGGSGSYTYSWAPSGVISSTATGLTVGTKTVTVTDGNACKTIKTVVIAAPAVLAATTTTVMACNGSANGVASTSVSGGTSPYTYTWTGSASSASTATGLATGNYTVTIGDANSCPTITSAVIISQPSSALTVAVPTKTDVSCFGGNDGSASVIASGATGPYTYTWTNSTNSIVATSSIAIGLAQGDYTVKVNDVNICGIVNRTVTVSQPLLALAATITQTNVACNGNATGSASISVSGGNGGYSYSWTPSGVISSSATGLAATDYTVTVKDSKFCTYTTVVGITQPSTPVLTVTAITATNVSSCFGYSNGIAAATVSGGTSPYTYTWTGSVSSSSLASGIAAGAYTVTVADANNCTTTKTVSVTQPSSLSITTSSTNVSCNGGSNGSATVTASGATGPYTYTWTNSAASVVATSSVATGLAADNYTVTVNDANSCGVVSKSLTITQPVAVLAVAITSVGDVLCNGDSSGSATVTASGGNAGTLTYSWTPSGGTSSIATNLAANNYTIKVTDTKNCTATNTFVVNQPTTPVLSAIITVTNVACNGGATGIAVVTTTGGSGTYTNYAWTGSASTSSVATGLNLGVKSVTVTDGNGCKATQSISITQPAGGLSATASQTNLTCNGGSNGVVSMNVSGGTTPYTYTWSAGSSTTNVASGLSVASGTSALVTVTVTDNNGCLTIQTASLIQPAVFSPILIATPVTCVGSSNGSASVTTAGVGGTAPFTYTWSPTVNSASTIANLTAGTYSCSIRDNCSVTVNRTVSVDVAYPALSIPLITAQSGSICSGQPYDVGYYKDPNTGFYSGFPTPTLVFSGANSYSVNGVTANSITLLPLNTVTYSVRGTVNNTLYTSIQPSNINTLVIVSCISNPVAMVVTVNPVPFVSINSASICLGSTTTLTPNGASTYSVNGVATATSNFVFSPTVTSNYSVTGTSALGCTANNTAVATVTVRAIPTLAVPPSAILCTGNAVTITPTLNPAGTSYTLATPAGTTTNLTLSGAMTATVPGGTYVFTVTGTSSQGCVSSSSPTLNVTFNVSPTVAVTSGAICQGETYSITISSTNGAGSYSVGGTAITGSTYTVSPSSAGTSNYNVTSGSTVNSCTSTAATVAQVTVNPNPLLSVNSATICSGNTVTLTPSGAGTNGTYTITGGSNTVMPMTTSSYSVTGTSQFGCVATNTAVATVSVNITPTISVTNPTICVGEVATITASGADTYTINGSIFNNLSGNNFTLAPTVDITAQVMGTSIEGCVSDFPATTVVYANPLPIITATGGAICQGSSFTINTNGAVSYTLLPNLSSNLVVNPFATTNYSVIGSSTAGCVGDATPVTVSVYNVPNVGASAVPSVVCLDASTSINLSASGASTYTWSTGQTGGLVSASHPSSTITYTVIGRTNQAQGACTNTAEVTVSVDPCVGITEITNNALEVNVYPNPNNGMFTVETPENARVMILNGLGQVVYEQVTAASKTEIALSDMANGIYFVKVVSGNGQKTIKVIKQ